MKKNQNKFFFEHFNLSKNWGTINKGNNSAVEVFPVSWNE